MKRLLVAMPGLTATFTGERGEVFMAELVATLPDLHRDELLPAHPLGVLLGFLAPPRTRCACSRSRSFVPARVP